jgi:hypothetical protein
LPQREAIIDFRRCDNFDAPLDIMVPGKTMEMVQGLDVKEKRGARQWPLIPKWLYNTIQQQGLSMLQELLILP